MNTWWLSLDTDYTSYNEIKYRKVVAQGWRSLGNLTTLLRLIPNKFPEFVKITQLLGDATWEKEKWWQDKDRNEANTPTIMWNLFNIKEGDLIVAVEGRKVKGVCQFSSNSVQTYQHQAAYEYAQTVGHPVQWVDWSTTRFGFTPSTSSKGFKGIKRLEKEKNNVVSAWEKYLKSMA